MKWELILVCIAVGQYSVLSQDLIALNVDGDASDADVKAEPLESNSEVFVPTDTWQEIKPGQAIPRGLHVRINMQTGKKEAKFLEEEPRENARGSSQESVRDPFSPEALKEALKNIKNDAAAEETEQIKSKFRSMDELKQEFSDINMKVESEIEIMKRLVAEFESAEVDEDRAEAMQTLEYYVHKFDNAVDFLALRGVERILVPSLNSTVDILQEMAGFLIGSAAQSNPKVQIAFLEAGIVNTLLRILSSHSSPTVCGKALYGISAILRNFPEAQSSFFRNGGLDVFKSMFKHQGKLYDKLKIKMLTLVQDLVGERQHIDLTTEDGRTKMEQYDRTNLQDMLVSSGWCDTFNEVLILPRDDRQTKRDDIVSTMSEEFPVRVEHDSIEKIIMAMSSLNEHCKHEFNTTKSLDEKLAHLSAVYEELRRREEVQGEEDLFFTNIHQTIQTIRSTVTTKTEL